MNQLIRNNHGFTLLEMLLVLSILIITSSIVYQFAMKISEKQSVNQFIQQVQLDIQRVQALSLSEPRLIYFSFSDRSYQAYYENAREKIVEGSYPPEVQLIKFSTLRKITIFSGEFWEFGTIRFHTPLGERQIIVNIQKGRMKIVEL
ncbi:Tfp pilus assembly protein FimT/FimU [Lysinibacillus sp. BW-2-10]|uniref:pilus assembly FimT family protein n=1 Tax=Lysinibacillus sp. BW-2-10 TaxID=2590030 RepID=UPI0011813B92|nr:type II secretion system protein [Lysinibacillus sp. BW-2-10]TSI08551.1 type II secretion system protein [Lysinibacillus sp. BW-2-10]